MYQNDPCRVLTCEVRCSYVNLVTPRSIGNNPNDKPKYSMTLLIPKTETACIEDINNAINAAAQAGLNTKFGGVMPQFAPIVHDGDGVNSNGMPYGDECKGHWVLAASSTNKPGVVHQSNVRSELAPTDIYSGMYARVTLRFYPYNTANKRGVGCGLGNVMKTRDGDPLGGGTTAEQDFAEFETAAPMAAPAQPTAPVYGWSPQQQATQTAALAQGYVNPVTGQMM